MNAAKAIKLIIKYRSNTINNFFFIYIPTFYIIVIDVRLNSWTRFGRITTKRKRTCLYEQEKTDRDRACELFEVSRSSYYERINRRESRRAKENKELNDRIIKIYEDSGRRYGAPKIYQELAKQGVFISLKRVQKRMKDLNIRSIIVKKWRPSNSDKGIIQERENLLKRDFSTTGLNQKWVTDITYIHTVEDDWCYLSSIQDLHSKKIIAWSFGKKMTTGLVLDTLNQAVQTQTMSKELVLHSDLGSQYTSQEYKDQINKLGIQHSFSHIESFHATLKKEEVYQNQYQSFEQAKLALF